MTQQTPAPLKALAPQQALLAMLMVVLALVSCGTDADIESAEPVGEQPTATTEPAAAEPATSEPATADVAADDADHDGADHDDADHHHGAVDVDLFVDGALANEPTSSACTLSGGTETTCLSITIAGYPADGEIGPFCPATTSATADEVGIWFDGNSVYDIDGQFITDLPEIYGDDNWNLANADGTVRVTNTLEAFEAAARPDVDPAYQNYCVEGQIAWLDGGEPITSTVEIPAKPVATGTATRINGTVGVTLNGVIIDGQAPVDAILSAYTIAAFDDCGGHVNPVAGYHIHGATGCSEVGDAEPGDTPMFGYALDGHPIHSPLDDTQAAAADLDECNGHTTEMSGYHYHANSAESNAVLSCLMGETAASSTGRRGPGGPPQDAPADESASAAPGSAAAAPAAIYDAPTEASDYLGNYTLIDEGFGTMVTVTVDGDTRTLVANSLPDHETGEFPNSGNPNTISEQALTLEFPTAPTYVGNAGFAMQPGVAVNGVTFEPGTAETVTCASGENYRVEGLQDLFDLGMDFNNAHVQPTGKYHYHGVADLLVDTHSHGDDLVLVGFAADGFLMYYSASGAYGSSYELAAAARSGTDCVGSGALRVDSVTIEGTAPDGTYGSDWVYVDGLGQLDECNGVEINGTYAYVLTDEFPYIPRCLNGEFTATGPGGQGGPPPGAGGGQGDAGGPGGNRPGSGQGGARPGGAPDFTEAADALGVTVEELQAALGGQPPDLDAAAAEFGITIEELRAILPPPPGR